MLLVDFVIFNSMEKTFIYGLISKSTPNIIRYVGKADNPLNRLKRHIHNTKYSFNVNKKLTHKDYWIIQENYEIDIIILEECDKDVWIDREKHHMSIYENLTNTSEGGKGGSGIKYKLTYNEVKDWVSNNLNIKSKSEWYKHLSHLPDFITHYPREVYLKRGWISWIDFLNSKNKWDNNVNYLTYNEAKTIIHELKIRSGFEYKEFVKNNKIPKNIPNRPERFYKNRGWVSMGDFLGTGRIANQYKKKTLI